MTTSADRSTTVGLLYPAFLHADPNDQLRAAEDLRAAFPATEVVLEPWVDTSEQRTRRSAPDYLRGPDDSTPVTDEQRATFARIDVALALDLPFDVAALAPRLRWVQATGTGIGQFASSGLADAGIRLTNAAGTSADEIGEFVLARILEHAKRLPEIAALQRDHRWQPVYGRSVAGRTVGLVGLGAINERIAEMARALGMRVVACRRTVGDPPPFVDRLYRTTDLAEMVAGCDVVVAALPETAETRDLFDRDLFAAMRPGALFCNVGRGSAVIDADLVHALASGHLGGAALDVFDEEPLPPGSPYWDLPTARVSAHCSSVPDAAIARVHDLFRDNLRRHLAGEPLRNEVDLARGY